VRLSYSLINTVTVLWPGAFRPTLLEHGCSLRAGKTTVGERKSCTSSRKLGKERLSYLSIHYHYCGILQGSHSLKNLFALYLLSITFTSQTIRLCNVTSTAVLFSYIFYSVIHDTQLL